MSSLRSDLARAQKRLDAMKPGAVVSDKYGISWRLDNHGIHWESTEPDGETFSSFQLAQFAPITEVQS